MRISRHSSVKRAVTALSATALATGVAMAPAGTASAHDDNDVAISQTNLVSDQPLASDPTVLVDPDLINPWGVSFGTGATPTPLWVSDNGQDVSTLYKTGPTPPAFVKVPLTVSIPGGAPTGQVFNPSATEFVVKAGSGSTATSGPAKFIFASESGWITGWNPNVPMANSTEATRGVQVPNGVLKGLALASANGADYLYAADFANGKIDVVNSSFELQNWKGAFHDGHIPRDFAPFNVQLLNGNLYVAYAKKNPGTVDDLAGLGNGFVSVFDTSGHLVKRLLSHHALNSPWGLAIAPSSWGEFSGALLVGNFGDGFIHGYDATTGQPIGALRGADKKPVWIEGLWALQPGNGVAGDPQSVLFTAGPGEESHGLVGALSATAAPDADD